VVINYLDVKRIAITPNEAYPVLIIDANAVLSLALPFQSFKMVPGKDGEITQQVSSMQLPQLTLRDPGDVLKALRALAFK
jgi:hypothetical protein